MSKVKTVNKMFLVATIVICMPACTSAEQGPYTTKSPSYDGTGKVYKGREISKVMGHLGAGWLERSDREQEERTDLLLNNLPLEDHFVVADIGAGTGYFSFPIAKRVPQGKVLAVDIEQKMLEKVSKRLQQENVDNIETVLGAIDDPKLPADSVDLVLMVDAYHEFSHPLEMGRAISNALKPGGFVVLIEYRGEDPAIRIKPLHKMTVAQAKIEMAAVGLQWLRTEDFLPTQHFMLFKKPD